MLNLIKALVADDAGATGIEYGLIASLIAMAAVGGFETLGNEVQDHFNGIDAAVQKATRG